MPLLCNDGPYIWDKSKFLEGIGSQFQRRKPSFIASHVLQAKWIGNLTNEHCPDEGDQSSYFGLSYTDCDQDSLEIYEKQKKKLHFVYTTREKNPFEYISTITVAQTTVLVFNWDEVAEKCYKKPDNVVCYDESHNFAVFDSRFLKRFQEQRSQRQTPKRLEGEYWVSIHFRWGDVKTKDSNRPDYRNGLGFSNYCVCVKHILSMNPRGLKIFLFAENLQPPVLSCPSLKDKRVQFLAHSNSWKTDIDIMSQSQLLIGGGSSFFVLGAYLCENCTVIHKCDIKFAKSEYEKTLPSRFDLVSCKGILSCYIKNIAKTLNSYNSKFSKGI